MGVIEPTECILDGDESSWVTFDASDSMVTDSRKEDTWVIFDAVLSAMQCVWVTVRAINSTLRAVLGVLGVVGDILGRSGVVLGGEELRKSVWFCESKSRDAAVKRSLGVSKDMLVMCGKNLWSIGAAEGEEASMWRTWITWVEETNEHWYLDPAKVYI